MAKNKAWGHPTKHTEPGRSTKGRTAGRNHSRFRSSFTVHGASRRLGGGRDTAGSSDLSTAFGSEDGNRGDPTAG